MTPRTVIEPARLAGGALLRTQSDERLVDLVRAGNDRAFEAIVHRYRAPLLRYCRRFLPAGRAEDAVQQAFLNAFRAMRNDDRAIDLRPWLYRIAHNAALNALRAGLAADADELTDQIDGVERPDQALERRERLTLVVAAVQALPPRQRDAVILRELEGRSSEEIAAELQVSGCAVRQLLNRARTTLRAGATAVVPEWALVRLATAGGDPVAVRVAEIVAAGGGTAALAKVGATVVVAGAVAGGAVTAPLGGGDGGGRGSPDVAHAAPADENDENPASTAQPGAEPARAGKRVAVVARNEERRARSRRDDDGRSAGTRGDSDDGDDERRDDDDPGDDEEAREDDRREEEREDDEDDSSGPGSGGDDFDDDDRSGSNSGSDDDVVAAPVVTEEPSNSGPGSFDAEDLDGSDSSGPGSGGSDHGE